MASSELAQAIIESAGRLGINPSDLATAISYETGGTFDPWARGPTTKWGEHRGLIQWGEPQRARYGVSRETSVPDQMRAVERYLADTGVKKGAGLLDIYSAINAGRVGRPDARDAVAGGAPGTVADKVAGMLPHRLKANALLGLPNPNDRAAPTQFAPPASTPLTMAAQTPASSAPAMDAAAAADPLMALLQSVPLGEAEQRTPQVEFPQIQYAAPPGLARARALARAMNNNTLG